MGGQPACPSCGCHGLWSGVLLPEFRAGAQSRGVGLGLGDYVCVCEGVPRVEEVHMEVVSCCSGGWHGL